MTRRLDHLATVQKLGLRSATAALARAAGATAQQGALVARLDVAVATMAPQTGAARGDGLAARMELAQRIHVAQAQAATRLSDSVTAHEKASQAHNAVRRAVDVVADMKRRATRVAESRRATRGVPERPAQ